MGMRRNKKLLLPGFRDSLGRQGRNLRINSGDYYITLGM